MKHNLLHPDSICTDPDTLQFCLKISDTEYWNTEVGMSLLDSYLGHPSKFLLDAQTSPQVKAVLNKVTIYLPNPITNF